MCQHNWNYVIGDYYHCQKCQDVGMLIRKGRKKGSVKRMSSTVQEDVKTRILNVDK